MLTPWDIDVMARTLYGEARGEPDEGKVAVAHVIRTRWLKGPLRTALAAVCLKPRQFSCWDDGNRAAMAVVDLESPQFLRCMAIAWGVIAGIIPDNTGGADHYLNPKALERLPAWYDPKKVTARHGAHEFLRLA
ncbi:cell wall hydrolase [Benzoatithermus flavus]|uniref:Cell wall hydrolase n=1 Tax=Benzoatithermus flavus TaxID=3108223 RepID=A0ABU8XP50_9PROT